MDSAGGFVAGVGQGVGQLLQQAVHQAVAHAAENAPTHHQRKFANKLANKLGHSHVQRKVEGHITRSEFLKGLYRYIPPPLSDGRIRPKKLRDAEFQLIGQWCARYGKQEWGRRPRTFIILHMIGCEDALDGFVNEHLSDFALPYSEENLPHAVSGDQKRRQFLEYQNYVLTAHAHDLEKAGGAHQNMDDGSAEEFFSKERELGSGGFGEVDEVVSYLSLKHYARKRFGRGRSFRRDQVSIKSFENELQILKKLSHRHLVKLVGSYTDRHWVGIIMLPVADMDLSAYLDAERVSVNDKRDRQICLRRFFGCLATALKYLHAQEIRHKDIKPKNILVKNRDVLLADFGTSHNWSDDTRSTTEGTARGFTPRYCAPEVVSHGSRNPSTDIWSLGCVFIEMATVIHDKTVRDMNSFFEMNGTGQLSVRSNEEATHQWVEKLSKLYLPSHDMQPLQLSQEMVRIKPQERLTATQVVSKIFDFREMPNAFCGACCDKSNDTTRATANGELWPETNDAIAASLIEGDPFLAEQYDLPEWEQSGEAVDSFLDEMTLRDIPEDLPEWEQAGETVNGLPDEMSRQDVPEDLPEWEQAGELIDSLLDEMTRQNVPEDLPETQEHALESSPILEMEGGKREIAEGLAETPEHVQESAPIPECVQESAQTPVDHGNWQQPDFEQIDDGLTLRDIYPDEEELKARAASISFKPELATVQEDAEKETGRVAVETPMNSQVQSPELDIPDQNPRQRSMTGRHTGEDFRCRWPGCAEKSGPAANLATHEELSLHYLDAHFVHDFAGSSLLAADRLTQNSGTVVPSTEMPNFVLVGSSLTSSVARDEVDHLRAEGVSIRGQTPDGSGQPRSSQGPTEKSSSAKNVGGQSKASDKRRPESKATGSAKKVLRWAPVSESITPNNFPKEQRTSRFDMLPEDKRPEPAATTSSLGPVQVNMTYHEIMPEPLEEPLLPSMNRNSSDKPGENTTASPDAVSGPKVPQSSRVPSYFLASMNRFTRIEVDALIPRARLSSLVPPPLFVYGSLMFPSILRARAEAFIGAEGVYSKLHQRRLRTDASDWSRINFSLQHAAEQMTPAVLEGFCRWRPSGFSCAAIESAGCSCQEYCRGEVRGFVVFGLSQEALNCLNYTFGKENLRELYGNKHRSSDERPYREAFRRERVRVDIGLKGGGSMGVDAVTYVWDGMSTQLSSRWDVNDFSKSSRFQKLSGIGDKQSRWVEEEQKLADMMGITFVLGGDALCDAILRDNREELCRLVDSGENVNAPSRIYGSPIQAAAAEGSLEVVQYLLKNNADVNARGGQYVHPLIAATVQGREDVAKALIKAGADVLADGGQYVSPLYQAVDFTDPDLAHMLLEKGAWLSKDYQELLDLAAERGNKEVTHMLEQYDVRNLHLIRSGERSGEQSGERRRSIYPHGSDSEHSDDENGRTINRKKDDRQVEKKSSKILTKVMWQLAILKGQPGKWTGIKGVKVMRAAMDAGLSERRAEMVLRTIGPHLQSSYKLLDFLTAATRNPANDVATTPVTKELGGLPKVQYTEGHIEMDAGHR